MGLPDNTMQDYIEADYAQGFVTDIESDTLPPGLDEGVVCTISERKGEPQWMLEKRLAAFRHWRTMREPNWASLHHPRIDYQAISYFSSPKKKAELQSLDEVDPELLATYEKLGIPIDEQKALSGVAVDAVFDSVSVATTFRKSDLLLHVGGAEGASRSGQAVSGKRSARPGQFLCGAEQCGVQRWHLRLCTQGGALSDGAFYLFSHQ